MRGPLHVRRTRQEQPESHYGRYESAVQRYEAVISCCTRVQRGQRVANAVLREQRAGRAFERLARRELGVRPRNDGKERREGERGAHCDVAPVRR